MTTPPALQFDTYYHIYNRGNNGENIFIEARNYHHFMKLYAYHVEPVAETYAYCLLRNHFHFLVRIKSEEEIQTFRVSKTRKVSRKVSSPSHQFGNLFNAYTKAINKTYQRSGSLFEKPFHRKPVTDDRYFTKLVAYIHHNPQIHGFTADFGDWPYSSYQAILSNKPTRIRRETTLAWFGGLNRFADFHRAEDELQGINELVVDL